MQIFRSNLEEHSAALTGEPHFCRFMSPSPRQRGLRCLRCRTCSGPEALCQYLLSPTSEIRGRLRAGLALASSSSATPGLQQTPEDQQLLQQRSGHKIEMYIGLSCAEEFRREIISWLLHGRRLWSGELAGPIAGARRGESPRRRRSTSSISGRERRRRHTFCCGTIDALATSRLWMQSITNTPTGR